MQLNKNNFFSLGTLRRIFKEKILISVKFKIIPKSALCFVFIFAILFCLLINFQIKPGFADELDSNNSSGEIAAVIDDSVGIVSTIDQITQPPQAPATENEANNNTQPNNSNQTISIIDAGITTNIDNGLEVISIPQEESDPFTQPPLAPTTENEANNNTQPNNSNQTISIIDTGITTNIDNGLEVISIPHEESTPSNNNSTNATDSFSNFVLNSDNSTGTDNRNSNETITVIDTGLTTNIDNSANGTQVVTQPELKAAKDNEKPANTIDFIGSRLVFYSDEEPEFPLPAMGTAGAWDKISLLFQPQFRIMDMLLSGPDKQAVTSDIILVEKGDGTYTIKIKKLSDFQPGNYSLQVKIDHVGQNYLAQANFQWLNRAKKLRITKDFSFSLESAVMASKKSLGWNSEKQLAGGTGEVGNTAENSQINVSVASDAGKNFLELDGACQKDYFVILLYARPDDYDKNPSQFIYNKAFSCQGNAYHYQLKDLPDNLADGTYYVLVAEQGLRGPWQPITAIQPVKINTEYRYNSQ